MKFIIAGIVLLQNACSEAFVAHKNRPSPALVHHIPHHYDNAKVSPQILTTKLLFGTSTSSSWEETYNTTAAGWALNPDNSCTNKGGLPRRHDDDPRITTTTPPVENFFLSSPKESRKQKLDYDDIQKIIDVSRPYYKLENEICVSSDSQVNSNKMEEEPPLATHHNPIMQHGFCCTVEPEMSIGREQGSHISFSEAGRHMAIAGSVVAALNQPASKKNGKRYYLAMDCLLETQDAKSEEKLLPDFSLHHDSLLKNAQILEEDEAPSERNNIVISAVCCELTNRKAVCEVMMHFPESYGEADPYYLHVTYSVLAPKVFRKFYPPPALSLKNHDEEHKAAKLQSQTLGVVAPSSLVSPYAQFKGLPLHSFETLSLSADRSHIKMRNSSMKKIPAEICAGHFEGNPALPIAFLATFCADLSGMAISVLIEKSVPFETKCAGPLAADRRMKSDAGEEGVAGYYQHGAGAGGSILKFISVKVDAFKLVQSNTHGISLLCEVVKEEDSNGSSSSFSNVYSSDISILSLAPTAGDDTDQTEEVLIATMNIKFELLD